jgi:hypothetical protein
MDVAQLIEIALSKVEERRVAVVALESADVPARVVGELASLLSEVTGILVAVGPAETIRASGSWEEHSYQISISASTGISGDGITVLDRLLDDPMLATGIAKAARLAADQGVRIRLIGDAATTAIQVMLAAHVVQRAMPTQLPNVAEEPSVEFVPHEMARQALVPVDTSREDSEAFLESVFGVLRNPWHEPDRPEPAVLQVRVPGESFSMIDDDAPSTSAAEAAVDIRSALSTFDQGRRAAEIAPDAVEATA